jgi:hypothetical protein
MFAKVCAKRNWRASAGRARGVEPETFELAPDLEAASSALAESEERAFSIINILSDRNPVG